MVQNNVLLATGVAYYHANDEAAFFEWLDRMKCVKGYHAAGHDLFIELERRPTRCDLLELLALFFRYEIDMTQLRRFETKTNRSWMRDPEKYWHSRMYRYGN